MREQDYIFQPYEVRVNFRFLGIDIQTCAGQPAGAEHMGKVSFVDDWTTGGIYQHCGRFQQLKTLSIQEANSLLI